MKKDFIYRNGEDWVDFSNLVFELWGNKKRINWKNSIGKHIDYCYKGEKNAAQIIGVNKDFNNHRNIISLKNKDGIIKEISDEFLRRVKISSLFIKEKSNEDFLIVKNNNKIDLRKAPKTKRNGQICINWVKVKNFHTKCVYNNTQYQIILDFVKFENNNFQIKVTHGNNSIITYNSNLLKIQLANLFGKPEKQRKYNYEIGYETDNYKVIQKITIRDKKGINNTGYLLLCKHSNKTFERLERDMKFTGSPYVQGTKGVSKENSLYSESHLLKYLKNPNDAKKVRKNSKKYIDCKCPNCGKESKRKVYLLKSIGLPCTCKNSFSYPERVIASLLDFNNIEYEMQKVFSDSQKRYDFYIKNRNKEYVIETHGEQHYQLISSNSVFDTMSCQLSDAIKKIYCIRNQIEYIEVDCRKSEYNFISKNFSQTNFFNEFSLKLPNKKELPKIIEKINEASYIPKDKLQKIIHLHKKGISLDKISKTVGLSSASYVAQILQKNDSYIERPRRRKVVCVEYKEVYTGVREASRVHKKSSNGSISSCLTGKLKRTIDQRNGNKVTWMYLEDYIEHFGEDGLTYHKEDTIHNDLQVV